MTPAARLSAAIELIDTIDAQRIPAAKALKEWGTAHRYAGSGDRAAISGLIWDVLRRRASSAWIMDENTPRARVLGMLKLERGLDVDAIAAITKRQRANIVGANVVPHNLRTVRLSNLDAQSVMKDAVI